MADSHTYMTLHTASFWNSLYMRKIKFFFYQCSICLFSYLVWLQYLHNDIKDDMYPSLHHDISIRGLKSLNRGRECVNIGHYRGCESAEYAYSKCCRFCVCV
jgi:hypothetical protein